MAGPAAHEAVWNVGWLGTEEMPGPQPGPACVICGGGVIIFSQNFKFLIFKESGFYSYPSSKASVPPTPLCDSPLDPPPLVLRAFPKRAGLPESGA